MTKTETLFRYACIALIMLTIMIIVDTIINASLNGARPDGTRAFQEPLPKIIEGKSRVVRTEPLEVAKDDTNASPG